MRRQIATAYILLLVATLALLSFALFLVVRQTYLVTLQAGIAGQARLVAARVAPDDGALRATPALGMLVDEIHRQLDARVTVIATDGSVIADSLPSFTANVAGRPEVRDALLRGQGVSARPSATTGDNMFYVAVIIGSLAAPLGIARVGVPLTTITQAEIRSAAMVVTTALLATLVALGLALMIARRTTRPLLHLRAVVGRLAEGNLQAPVPLSQTEEVAALAEEFNRMAVRLRDVLASRETERQRLASVLATMADGILMLDATDQLVLVNQAAERLLALAGRDPAQGLAALAVGSTLLQAVACARAAADPSRPVVIERLALPTTHRSLRVLVTPVPAPEPGQLLVMLQDLTDLRQMEETRRLWLANISHDLRTPLTSLQAMIETLQDGALDDRPAAIDFLGRMDAEVQGLNRLVREFLELSRIEAGQILLDPMRTDLGALLTASADRMAVQADHQQVTLRVSVPALLPLVHLDPLRITEVLLNLLQNALTHTPPGGSVLLQAKDDAQAVAITVEDSGIGISPAALPHIFERFYKAEPARSGGGTGLGLAIARHLVELHGGRIWAESALGQGTRVTFTLPYPAPVPEQPR